MVFIHANHRGTMVEYLKQLGYDADCCGFESGPEIIFFFLLSSAEHEISNACKYKNMKKLTFLRLR